MAQRGDNLVKYQMKGKGRKKMNKARIAIATLTAALAAGGAFAQAAGTGRDAFLKEQAVAEMQRVSAQVDILSSNQEELAERLRKAESAKAEIESLRAEIAALKGTVAELRREIQGVRGEIVQDLSKKIASMQPPAQPKPQPKPQPRAAYSGPVYEYTVQSGDSLFIIAKAFDSTVQKIKDINGLKSDRLSIGQKIKIPKE